MSRARAFLKTVYPPKLWPQPIVNVLINEWLASAIVPIPVRVGLLRAYGMDIDPSAVVQPNIRFGGKPLTLGPSTYLNHSSLIDAHVSIGARSGTAPGCRLVTSTHEIGDHAKRFGGRYMELPITIGEGVWVGTGVTILPGVTVGDGCLIAAGAVVTTDCEPDGLYAGVPARRIRDLP